MIVHTIMYYSNNLNVFGAFQCILQNYVLGPSHGLSLTLDSQTYEDIVGIHVDTGVQVRS